jgi:hypothetical protein
MAPIQRPLGLVLSAASGMVAAIFALFAMHVALQSATIGTTQYGRMWLAVGITCVASTFSLLCFLFRHGRIPASPRAKATAAFTALLLASGVAIFLSLPP